jgi:type II secretory ATPase GspE/PulE/Tfp pilus assembly ATPase PilB-like protein
MTNFSNNNINFKEVSYIDTEYNTQYRKVATPDFYQIIDNYVRQAIDIHQTLDKNVENSPIVKILDNIINFAINQKASDVHIEPQTDETLIRYRVDGLLQEILHLPRVLHGAIQTRIRIMSNLRIDEQRAAQDGRFNYKYLGKNIDVRVSIVPILHGSKIVMRLLEDKNDQHNIVDIGLNENEQFKILANLKKSYGLILVTGPTSSGKTTTLYTLLKLLNNQKLNITTIEDPIEYGINGVNQIQINPVVGLSFAEGLRNILRQDPNVIMVGEIRDKETATLAVNAAMTGHLVLSSLHTNNAATSIPRLLEMGVEPFMVTSTLNLIIAQRLVRKNCPSCSTPDTEGITQLINFAQKNGLTLDTENINIRKGQGCPDCFQSGYKGRVGIFEVLTINDSIRDMIQNRLSAPKIEATAKQQGMKSLMQNGVEQIASGITTLSELIRVINQ